MFRLVGMAFVLAAGVALPAQAKGVLYDCDITQKREGMGWISDKMALVVTGTGQVVVSDAVILHYYKKPLQARISRNNDRKLTVRWTLKNVVNNSNQTTPAFEYTATVTKSDNRIAVYATPDGYPNRFTGKGTCTLRRE